MTNKSMDGVEQKGSSWTSKLAVTRIWPRKSGRDRPSDDVEKPASHLALFRYANRFQRMLTAAGVVASFLNGLPMPIMLLIYGGTIDTFVPTDFCDIMNEVNISERCPPHIDETNINQFYFECNWTGINITVADLTSSIGTRAAQFALIGAISWVLSALQTILLSNSAERIMRNVRCELFNNVMYKKVEWFDETSAGAINSLISDTAEKFKPGIGDKIGMVCQGSVVIVASLIVAITSGWKLSLVMFTTAPFVIVLMAFLTKKMSRGTFVETKAYQSAGTIAQETFANIRTVHAYNGTGHMQDLYRVQLGVAYKKALMKGLLTSFAVGGIWLLMFSSYALGFWYGGQLLTSDNMSAGLVLIVFFGVQTAVFTFGGNVPNYTAITESRSAASSIYKIIDEGKIEEACPNEVAH